MALTQRGKVVIGVVATAVVGVLAVLAFTGNAPGPLKDIVEVVAGGPDPCPLTGKARGDEGPPDRPVLAVKVENTPRRVPARGSRTRRRHLRGARGGWHHPLRRALPVP